MLKCEESGWEVWGGGLSGFPVVGEACERVDVKSLACGHEDGENTTVCPRLSLAKEKWFVRLTPIPHRPRSAPLLSIYKSLSSQQLNEVPPVLLDQRRAAQPMRSHVEQYLPRKAVFAETPKTGLFMSIVAKARKTPLYSTHLAFPLRQAVVISTSPDGKHIFPTWLPSRYVIA